MSLLDRIWPPLNDMVGRSFDSPLGRRSVVMGPTAVGMLESAKESRCRIVLRWPPVYPMKPASDCSLRTSDVCGA